MGDSDLWEELSWVSPMGYLRRLRLVDRLAHINLLHTPQLKPNLPCQTPSPSMLRVLCRSELLLTMIQYCTLLLILYAGRILMQQYMYFVYISWPCQRTRPKLIVYGNITIFFTAPILRTGPSHVTWWAQLNTLLTPIVILFHRLISLFLSIGWKKTSPPFL